MLILDPKLELFSNHFRATVIPVNCVGVHGAGVAGEWALRDAIEAGNYRIACKHQWMQPGTYYKVPRTGTGNFWYLATTKLHWRDSSKIKWVTSICLQLHNKHIDCDANYTIAVPALGCGRGGLAWDAVLPIMQEYFEPGAVQFHVRPHDHSSL